MMCDHSVGHFHPSCIRKWTETNAECPICKVGLKLRNDTPRKKWLRKTKFELRNIDYDEYEEEALIAALQTATDERANLVDSNQDVVNVHDMHIRIIAGALERKHPRRCHVLNCSEQSSWREY